MLRDLLERLLGGRRKEVPMEREDDLRRDPEELFGDGVGPLDLALAKSQCEFMETAYYWSEELSLLRLVASDTGQPDDWTRTVLLCWPGRSTLLYQEASGKIGWPRWQEVLGDWDVYVRRGEIRVPDRTERPPVCMRSCGELGESRVAVCVDYVLVDHAATCVPVGLVVEAVDVEGWDMRHSFPLGKGGDPWDWRWQRVLARERLEPVCGKGIPEPPTTSRKLDVGQGEYERIGREHVGEGSWVVESVKMTAGRRGLNAHVIVLSRGTDRVLVGIAGTLWGQLLPGRLAALGAGVYVSRKSTWLECVEGCARDARYDMHEWSRLREWLVVADNAVVRFLGKYHIEFREVEGDIDEQADSFATELDDRWVRRGSPLSGTGGQGAPRGLLG